MRVGNTYLFICIHALPIDMVVLRQGNFIYRIKYHNVLIYAGVTPFICIRIFFKAFENSPKVKDNTSLDNTAQDNTACCRAITDLNFTCNSCYGIVTGFIFKSVNSDGILCFPNLFKFVSKQGTRFVYNFICPLSPHYPVISFVPHLW